MRALGIDYGTKRTGLAIAEVADTDSATGIALPFEMFENLPDPQLAQAIADLVRREQITQIVIGLPLHSDGGISNQSKITERFILTLQQHIPQEGPAAIPITRFSEYLSSHDSESKLAGHFTRNQKRQRVDAIAAARILQDYLDHSRPPPPPPADPPPAP